MKRLSFLVPCLLGLLLSTAAFSGESDPQLLLQRAESGHADAQFRLGSMYASGEGVEQDFARAFKWWNLAASKENLEAQYRMGVLYAKGVGVPQDQAQAVSWFRLAAGRGHAMARFSLGYHYAEGLGIPHDNVKAYVWTALAAEQGVAAARTNAGVIRQRLSEEQLERASREIADQEEK